MFLADKEWIILKPGAPLHQRLARAIRHGCQLAPVQAFDTYGSGDAACVTRAASLGGFRATREDWYVPLPYPCHCPSAGVVLAHLNDVHRWTREQIADWLEALS